MCGREGGRLAPYCVAMETEEDGDGVIAIDCDSPSFDRFSILRDVLGYLLFSYNQIPLPLHQIENSLVPDTDLEVRNEVVLNPKEKREWKRKARAAAKEARNLRKLKESIQMFFSSVQAAFDQVEYIPSVLLVLGSSSKHPVAAFELQFIGEITYFSQNQRCSKAESFTKSLSRKIIRALISHDRSPAFTGTQKLLLFIKTYATSCVPEDFIPKRGYSCRVKKAHEVVIKIKYDHDYLERGDDIPSSNCSAMEDGMPNEDDIIWFQCKRNVRGVRCHAI